MILNTKQDYLNYLAMDSQAGKAELQILLDSRYSWTNTMVLTSSDPTGLVIDETHRIVGEGDEFYYQEYLEDVHTKLFMIGFTVAEVEELINEG